MAPSSFTLNTGATIPSIGLGTWQSSAGSVETAVYHAVTSGYRHIDCAFAYGNEHEVGKALARVFAEGTIKRTDVFVTSKLWSTYHSRAEKGLQKSLENLGLEYIDLFLMHWPVPLNPAGNHPIMPTKPDGSRDLHPDWTWVQTWKSLEKLQEAGKTKAIGVSNFSVEYLTHLLASSSVVPAVNQIESHPLLPQNDVVSFCAQHGIVVTAYSPFGSTGGPLLQDETVAKIAQKHNVAVGNVLLNYQVYRGIAAIPKSVTPERISENAKLIELDDEDLAILGNLHKEKGIKRFITPPWPVNFLFKEANWGEQYKPLL